MFFSSALLGPKSYGRHLFMRMLFQIIIIKGSK